MFQILGLQNQAFAQDISKEDVEMVVKDMILQEDAVMFLWNRDASKYVKFPIQTPQILSDNFAIESILDVHGMAEGAMITYLPPGGIETEKMWMALATVDPFGKLFEITHSPEAYIMCTIDDKRYFITVKLSGKFLELAEKRVINKLKDLDIKAIY